MKIKLAVIAEDFAYTKGKEIEFEVFSEEVINTVDIEVDGKIYTVDKSEFIRLCKAFE
jgi:hypothetical protein